MRKWFYVGVCLLVLFEVANIFFIMPLPYSQRVRSIDVAYALFSWRWWIRGACVALMVAGARDAWNVRPRARALVLLSLVVAGVVAYMTNMVMSADRIFVAPASLVMRPSAQNHVDPARLVVGVERNGDARAYPVQFIGYHHQVRDTIGGTPVLVTFCTVCRTGRAFSPVVDGRVEQFRLVGMDHFNAMLEDRTTRSWWRQVNGEAVAGPRKGAMLSEVPSRQMTLAQWLALHPRTLIMQPDSALANKYSVSFDYETGASRSALTGTDSVSWHDKAWVVGVAVSGAAKAYDWNRLKRERVVNDVVGETPVVVVLAPNGVDFFAFTRPDSSSRFSLRGDSLIGPNAAYALTGTGRSGNLEPVQASQEFWHSWRAFHPGTATY